MGERIKKNCSGLTIRAKYVIVFMGTVALSYLMIILIIGMQIEKYEERKMQSSFTLALEQASSFLKSETGNALYASEVLYQNSVIYEILEYSFLGKGQDKGEEYRKWYEVSQMIRNLKKENMYNIRIYASDQYLYTEQEKEFVKLSDLVHEVWWNDLCSCGEMPYWIPERKVIIDNREIIVHSLLRRIVFRSDYSKTVGVIEINIESEKVSNILENANVSNDGCVFLVDGEKKLIGISNHNVKKKIDWESMKHALQKEQNMDWVRKKIDESQYIFLTKEIPGIDWKMVVVIPTSELRQQVWNVLKFLMFMIIPIMSLASVIIYAFANTFSRRIQLLSEEMQTVCEGNLTSNLQTGTLDEMGQLYQAYQYMLEKVDILMKKQYEDGKAIKNAELKALQEQINPHFLYNTLELIRWEAMENDAVEISEQVQTLAKYYKAVLSGGADSVNLLQEIEQVERYIEIQNFRFDGRIEYNCYIPQALYQVKIMKLILQPLVENSILHGFAYNDINQHLCIKIIAYQEEEDLLILVEDNGIGMSVEQCENIFKKNAKGPESHYAVSNIHERLRLNYGDNYGLKYESENEKGTKVYIRLPYLND